MIGPDLKKAWKSIIAPRAKAALEDFRKWPLYERVGEPWPDAPKRFTPVTSLSAVIKGLKSSSTQTLEKAVNARLTAMYVNLSTLLNVRNQNFHEEWVGVSDVVWKGTEKALAALMKRLNWKPSDNDKGFWRYDPNRHVWQDAWEKLHPKTIEAPFHEHFLTIYRAGHVPAGLQGSDWKTCKFLYF